MKRVNILPKEEINNIFERFGVERRRIMAQEIIQIECDKLKPHQHNELIYGDEDISDLVSQIEALGKIIEPLKVKEDYTIISGHRRWKAAQQLNYITLPCEFVSFESAEEELAALVLYNYGRKKTNEQKAREGIALFETLSVEAVQRRLANLNQHRTDMDELTISGSDTENQDSDSSNADLKAERGLTRDKVAETVGIKSGRTFDRMREVIARVDKLKANGNTADSELYISVLNRTPSAARDLMDVPIDSLTDKDKENIKTGKVAPRKFLSKNKPNNIKKVPYEGILDIANEMRRKIRELNIPISPIDDDSKEDNGSEENETLHQDLSYDEYDHFLHTKYEFDLAISSFSEAIPYLLTDDGLEECKKDVEEEIGKFQKLLLVIESELENRTNKVSTNDKKKLNEKNSN